MSAAGKAREIEVKVRVKVQPNVAYMTLGLAEEEIDGVLVKFGCSLQGVPFFYTPGPTYSFEIDDAVARQIVEDFKRPPEAK